MLSNFLCSFQHLKTHLGFTQPDLYNSGNFKIILSVYDPKTHYFIAATHPCISSPSPFLLHPDYNKKRVLYHLPPFITAREITTALKNPALMSILTGGPRKLLKVLRLMPPRHANLIILTTSQRQSKAPTMYRWRR